MRLKDGSILSSNLIPRSVVSKLADTYNITKIYIGQVNEVLYLDHPRNRSKRFVEYDVLVNEKGITSSLFKNCRPMDAFGDINNFLETVLQPVTDGTRGRKDDTEPYIFKNGAIVLIGFIGGNKESPFILGSMQHPGIRANKNTTEVAEFTPVGSSTSRDARVQELPTLLPGSKSQGTDNDGQRILGEFQGLRWNINKDGELTVLYQGSKDAKGALQAADSQPTIIKINKDGEIILLDNLDQEIKVSRKDQKIYISSGNTEPDFIEIDRANKNITIECGNDQAQTIGNNQTTTIQNNEARDVSKNSNISVGENQQTKIGKIWTVEAGKQCTIIAPKVSIGGGGANEPLVLGNLFKTLYNAMVIIFNAHTHGGAVPAPAPTMASMTNAELSDFCFTRKTYGGN